MRESLYRLLVLFFLFLGGNLLAAVGIIGLAILQGVPMSEVMEMMTSGGDTIIPELVRSMVWVQTIATFIVPGLLYGLIFHRGTFAKYLQTSRIPTPQVWILATVIIVAGYGLVQLAYEVNQLIPMADWMQEMEEGALDIMEQILVMDSIWSLLGTLVIVAVLPAVGEELIFRGIVQQELCKLVNSRHLGIWLAAMVFSAIHLQFEGFLPRMVLGAILGYLYLWTKSIWVPIFIHFLNNGIQVIVLYATGADLSAEDPTAEMMPWWGIAISAIIFGLAVYRLLQIENIHSQSVQNESYDEQQF